MDDSRAPEPWIGGPATGAGCRLRWDTDGPACGAPVTLHVVSESAMYGVQCLPTCERHAPVAREAGIYVREHSPSFPGCDCRRLAAPRPLADDPTVGYGRVIPGSDADVPRPHGASITVTARPAYDPDLEGQIREDRRVTPAAIDGLTHYPLDLHGIRRPLCGAGKYLSRSAQEQYVTSLNWRLVSCPACRTTETP